MDTIEALLTRASAGAQAQPGASPRRPALGAHLGEWASAAGRTGDAG